MHFFRSPRCRLHKPVFILVLLAFVLTRAMMPVGFMPSSLHLGLPLALCPGDRYSAQLLQLSHQQHAHHGMSHQGHGAHHAFNPDCYFALLVLDTCPAHSVILSSTALLDEYAILTVISFVERFSCCIRPPVRAPPPRIA